MKAAAGTAVAGMAVALETVGTAEMAGTVAPNCRWPEAP